MQGNPVHCDTAMVNQETLYTFWASVPMREIIQPILACRPSLTNHRSTKMARPIADTICHAQSRFRNGEIMSRIQLKAAEQQQAIIESHQLSSRPIRDFESLTPLVLGFALRCHEVSTPRVHQLIDRDGFARREKRKSECATRLPLVIVDPSLIKVQPPLQHIIHRHVITRES